jgi:hypothetical protein
MVTWLDNNLRRLGLAARAAALVGMAVVAGAIAAPVAWRLGGWAGVAAAAAADGVCLAGGVVALICAHLLRGPRNALPALLTGMTARTGIPLIALLVAHLRGGPLAEAGLLYYVLVFYPVVLTAETILSLPQQHA